MSPEGVPQDIPPQENKESLENKEETFEFNEGPLEEEMRDDTLRFASDIEQMVARGDSPMEPIMKWRQAWEARLEPQRENRRAPYYFDLLVARIWLAMGKPQDAIEELEGLIARIQQSHYAERLDDLLQKAYDRIDDIENGMRE